MDYQAVPLEVKLWKHVASISLDQKVGLSDHVSVFNDWFAIIQSLNLEFGAKVFNEAVPLVPEERNLDQVVLVNVVGCLLPQVVRELVQEELDISIV